MRRENKNKAGIAGAKVAASEQNLFKSDKGSGLFSPLKKQGGASCPG